MRTKGIVVLIVISILAIASAVYSVLKNGGHGSFDFDEDTYIKTEEPKTNAENPAVESEKQAKPKKNLAGKTYIAVLYVEGAIMSDSRIYNQKFALDTIESLVHDKKNSGMMLFLDTPGGSFYDADELYLKIEEYKLKTGRPVYSYMGSMAASAGYYLACASEKIIANRNTLTGSIGVKMGSGVVDATELLDKIGVKSTSIYSGKNKNMMSPNEPFTAEQKEIMQSLVDEAYEQFIRIVSDGRNMPLATARRLSDGRPYSAKQALSNGLIDEIATYDSAIEEFRRKISHDMSADLEKEVRKPEVVDFRYKGKFEIRDLFGQMPIFKNTAKASRPFEVKAIVD